MKMRAPLFFSVLVAALLTAAYYPRFNNAQKEAVLMQTILMGLNQMHYKPQKINDDFSKKAYTLYLDRLDGGKRWFTQEDLAKLTQFELQLDDEAQTGAYDFFDLSLQLYNDAFTKTKGYYKELLAAPFDLSVDESITLNSEKKPFAKDDAELKDYWRKSLKYEVVSRVVDEINAQKDSVIQKPVAELEADARKEVQEVMDKWYQRLEMRKRSDFLNTYLNTITNIFDPHTTYFEPVDKQSFDIQLSNRLEGIGATLVNDEDYTKIASIIVGGPAWRGKDLEENDLVMKVAQGTDGEYVDIKGWLTDEVVKLIRGKKGTIVRLFVRKVDGTMKEISIERDLVQLEESLAKSAIMEGPSGETIGYINLPSFYVDFDDPDGNNCSDDVAKEIEELKADNVQAIILDLRNNGGGSLPDAIELSGLFVEKGPIVQVNSRSGDPHVYQDPDPKVQFTGPLVVMVNEMSASASEILAGALQDYGRAIIVGSEATYGKGTVQRFFDLDRAIPGNPEIKPLGEIKLTTQKFYRITGGSNQLTGVKSDIVLPDNYRYLEIGERDNDYPMEWSEIKAVPFSQQVYDVRPQLKSLRKKSEDRVKDNATFQLIEENAKRLKKRQDMYVYPLQLEKFQEWEAAQEAEAQKFKNIAKEPVISNVRNTSADKLALQSEEEAKVARNDNWLGNLKKDVYVEEVLNILHDLLQTK